MTQSKVHNSVFENVFDYVRTQFKHSSNGLFCCRWGRSVLSLRQNEYNATWILSQQKDVHAEVV